MSNLFSSSTPPFSKATYSPLRNTQDAGQDDDDLEPDSSSYSPSQFRGSYSSGNNSQSHHHYHPLHQQQPHHSPRQVRHRSHSRSSSRSVIMTGGDLQLQQQLQQSPNSNSTAAAAAATTVSMSMGTFAEGEDSEGEMPIPRSFTRDSTQPGSMSRRTSLHRPQSLLQTNSIAIPGIVDESPEIEHELVTTTTTTTTTVTMATRTAGPGAVIGATSESSSGSSTDIDTDSDTALASPPPKYTSTEDFGFAEPMTGGRHGRIDEEGGLAGYRDNQGDGLLMQASTTLVIAVSGLICAGWLLDLIQHWQVFVDISELIILIPILLNLKGNLEMNLASRLSTASNMGVLDSKASRKAFIIGNLALLQLQSLAVGSVAGLFAFVLGMLVHPTTNNINEVCLMITASMLCAAMSSFVLGSFMCGLVLICRRYNINPDNIACPLASSFGDLITLIILAGCAVVLQKVIDSPISIVILVFLLGLIPAWTVYVRRNKFVSEVVKEGWVPVFGAMVISSTAGLTLERYINQYPGMALISPVLNGLTGNIGSIYASRISTSLHSNTKENYRETERTLFAVHLPIQVLFLGVIGLLELGHVQWSVAVVAVYGLVAISLVIISLVMAKSITHMFWRWGYDPDNYVLPLLTSLIDVIGTGFLVLGFWALHYGSTATNTNG